MTVRAYFAVLRERWRLVAFMIIVGTALGVLITAITPRSYTATAGVLATSGSATDTGLAIQGGAFAQTQAPTLAGTIDSPKVIDAVRSDLNLTTTSADLRGKISAAAVLNQSLITVSAVDGSAAQAAALANSAARAFVVAGQEFETPIGSSRPLIKLTVTSPAVAPSAPTKPRPVLNIAVGVVLGLLLGLALAILRDLLDNRLKTVEDLALATDSSIMGVIIDDSKASRHPIASRAGSRSIRAENFRQLRANLQFANVDDHPRVIAITSSMAGEGKTMVAVNLASSLAEAGFNVCLVDADLRRPSVATTLGLPAAVGLTTVLIKQIALDEALHRVGTSLSVLTSGPTPPNPSEVLASSYVRELIRSLLGRVDFVILDTAPLLPVSDGSEVAALADGALLVARYKTTTDAQVKRARATLGQVDAKLLGVVLNRVPDRRVAGGYGYGYYRHEQAPPTDRGAQSNNKQSNNKHRLGRSGADEPAVHSPELSDDLVDRPEIDQRGADVDAGR